MAFCLRKAPFWLEHIPAAMVRLMQLTLVVELWCHAVMVMSPFVSFLCRLVSEVQVCVEPQKKPELVFIYFFRFYLLLFTIWKAFILSDIEQTHKIFLQFALWVIVRRVTPSRMEFVFQCCCKCTVTIATQRSLCSYTKL